MEEFFSSIIIITSMFGYGLITLPIAAAYIGSYNTIYMLSFFALITGLSIDLLFKSCEISNSRSYNDLLKKNQVILFLGYATLFLCGYFSSIKYAEKILLYTMNLSGLGKNVILFGFFTIQLCVSFLKTLDRLKYVSYFSIVACLSIIALTTYYGVSLMGRTNRDVLEPQYTKGISSFCFALCCQNMVPSIYQNLKNKSRAFLIPIFTAVFASLLFILMALMGFFAGGSALRDSNICDILDYFIKMDKNDCIPFLNNIAIGSFIILLNCSCLFQMFPVRNMFITTISKAPVFSLLFSIAWILSLVGILFFEIDLMNIFDIIGAYFTSTLAYILPPLIYFTQAKKYEVRYLITSSVVLSLGLFSIAYFSYIKLIN